jgi:hypothetical protein
MKQILAGVFVGLLLAGVIAGAAIPFLPPSARQPWVAWLIAGACVAGSVYVARRVTKRADDH